MIFIVCLNHNLLVCIPTLEHGNEKKAIRIAEKNKAIRFITNGPIYH